MNQLCVCLHMSYYQDSEDVQSKPECPDSLWKCAHLQQRLPICRWWADTLTRWSVYGCATGKPKRFLKSSLTLLDKSLLDNYALLSPTGSNMDSLRRQYPAVWPNFGEDMETVQSVHPASAWQESGRHAPPPGGRICFQHQWPCVYFCYPITPGCINYIQNGFSEACCRSVIYSLKLQLVFDTDVF